MPGRKRLDLIGQCFDQLLVIENAAPDGRGFSVSVCQCACGNIVNIRSTNLRSGFNRSCGCLKSISHIKHGACLDAERLPVYKAWMNMKRRCTTPSNASYRTHGQRGIMICDEWINDFEAFEKYVGPKPSLSHTLDRIDVNGNYEPGNVRWSTMKEQANNRRDRDELNLCGGRRTTRREPCRNIVREPGQLCSFHENQSTQATKVA